MSGDCIIDTNLFIGRYFFALLPIVAPPSDTVFAEKSLLIHFCLLFFCMERSLLSG
jgi:hypothetical protein